MNCCNITKLVTQQKHYIYFVAGQNNIKTLQFHKPSQTQNLFHMQTSKNGEKKDHAIRYQIKILTCSQARKYFKKKMLSCYQTENKHATLIIENIILKLFKNKNFTKKKGKRIYLHFLRSMCSLLPQSSLYHLQKKKKNHKIAIIFKLLGGLRNYIKK